jgi:hypothetical protein
VAICSKSLSASKWASATRVACFAFIPPAKKFLARYWPVDQFHLPGMRHERSNNLTHRIEVCDIVSIWPEPKIICSRRIRPRAGGADATLSCGKQTEQLAHNGPL